MRLASSRPAIGDQVPQGGSKFTVRRWVPFTHTERFATLLACRHGGGGGQVSDVTADLGPGVLTVSKVLHKQPRGLHGGARRRDAMCP